MTVAFRKGSRLNEQEASTKGFTAWGEWYEINDNTENRAT